MTELQKDLIGTIKLRSSDVVAFVKDVKLTFKIDELCDMIGINRNRYNYLNKHGQLDWHIAHLGNYVNGMNLTKPKGDLS
jgi:hypothetical protein